MRSGGCRGSGWRRRRGRATSRSRTPRGCSRRLWQIVDDRGADRERALVASGCSGLVCSGRRDRVGAAGLVGVRRRPASSGATWRAAFRVARLPPAGPAHLRLLLGAVAGGGDRRSPRRWPARGRRRGPARSLGGARRCSLVGLRLFGPSLDRLGPRLGCRRRAVPVEPAVAAAALGRRRVKRHVQPGERLLYEEGGFDLPGVPDPFQGGRFSGLLPDRRGSR